jgi:peptidyl-prolyl cis-trans isomerase SurA
MTSRRHARPAVLPGFTGLLAGLALMASLASAACGQQNAEAPAVSPDTWATVDGRPILRDQVEKAYRQVSDPSAPATPEDALNTKLTLLNELIVQEILLARAGELQIDVTSEELDAAFERARGSMPAEAFDKELTARQLSAGDVREALRRDLLTQKVIEREALSKVRVTAEDIQRFYDANKARFNLPEDAYHIAQIVVTPQDEPVVNNRLSDDATTREAANRKAQRIAERLKRGEAFDDVARDVSEDPETAPRGGDLGLVPLSALQQAPPPLRDAVLRSEPGNVQAVSQDGAHTFVMLVAREPAGQRDLSSPGVRQGIETTLRTQKEQLMRAAYLTAIRNRARVINHLAQRLLDAPDRLPDLGLSPR